MMGRLARDAADLLWTARSLSASFSDRFLNAHAPNVALTYRCSQACAYCFTQGLEAAFPQEMSLTDLDQVLTWLRKQRRHEVIFTGGEPTEHSAIREVMALLRRRRVRAGFYSNGLIDDATLDSFSRRNVAFLNLHFNYAPRTESHERFIHALDRLRRKKLPVALRFNVDNQQIDGTDALTLAQRFRCITIVCVTNPGFAYRRQLPQELLSRLGGEILTFLDRARAAGVVSIFARPLPLCMFPRATHRRLTWLHFLHTRCSPGVRGPYSTRIVINPDLSTFPCYALFKRDKKITEFESLRDVGRHHRQLFSKLRRQPLYDECTACADYLRGACQGGCLAFKTDRGWLDGD